MYKFSLVFIRSAEILSSDRSDLEWRGLIMLWEETSKNFLEGQGKERILPHWVPSALKKTSGGDPGSLSQKSM